MALADQYDSFLFDLDGVLFRGDRAVPGAAEAVRSLRQAGKGLAFVTNNSARTPEEIAAKLAGFHIEVASEEVVTSALATASLVAEAGGGSAFVVGETGIQKALADVGVEVLEGHPDAADVVVVGWDRRADYEKLKTAALLVQSGARLIATNDDAAYPAPDGLWPGAGALLALVTTTTGVRPEVVGKPHPPLLREAHARAGRGAALCIGDRLETDIAGAEALGWDSLLVLTGVARPPDLLRGDVVPTHVAEDLSALSSPVVRVEAAVSGDREAVRDLLHQSGLSPDSADRQHAGFVARDEAGSVVGSVGLDLAAEDAHVRGLAVRESLRRNRLGTLLLGRAVRQARQSGARRIWAVTETAVPFFGSLGFETVGAKDSLPAAFHDAVWSGCASTASTMCLALPT